MTHEEMSNFSHEDLANLRHLELSLEKTELLKTVLSNCENIPTNVKDKLQKLCQDFIQSCEKYDIDIPSETKELKNKKTLSIQDICAVITTIVSIITLALTAYSVVHTQPTSNTYINQTINYILNENYIININTIINEILSIK